MPRSCLVPVAVLAGTIAVASCASVEPTVHEPIPAVEIKDGADESAPKTLTLTPDAVRRLQIETVVVEDPTAIPYTGVVYDKTGAPWVYSSPQERTYIRVPVAIDRVVGDMAEVSAGPGAGTVVVTRAAINLYGAETGVDGGH
ncbi:MAG TPA: hypothetical protein VES21_15970 [Nocardioidaceae bacterium]|nr:hypothetical protein [Nocardioidaceae bacterium]